MMIHAIDSKQSKYKIKFQLYIYTYNIFLQTSNIKKYVQSAWELLLNIKISCFWEGIESDR